MKTFFLLLLIGLTLVVAFQSFAQVTNLTINGSSTSATFTSGDSVRWEYNLPTGATANGESWYDINQNGIIDPASDKAYFLFTQTDGDSAVEEGVPDFDGTVNGHVLFALRLGIVPGKYVLKFTHNSVGQSVTANVLPLASPAHLISGRVTPPLGTSSQYIIVEINRSESAGQPFFWHGFTDANGDYTIQMNADTAGNPWRVRVSDEFPPYVVSPPEIEITITGNHTGLDFTFVAAAAKVLGYLRDDNNTPLTYKGVSLWRNDGDVNLQTDTDSTGFYQIGLLASDLQAQTWRLQAYLGEVTTTHLRPVVNLPIINSGDSLFVNLIAYKVNSKIQGHVKVDGVGPSFPIQLVASNSDTAEAQVYADSSTGNFSMPVSNRIYNYNIFPVNLPPGYYSSSVLAHPGESGIVFNIFTTSVKERESGIPDQFMLKQNYPNPFNPTTTIDYDITSTTPVRLSIFNILGQEVKRLVDQEQHAGKYQATFDAAKLSSGVYFYRLTAGNYSTAKRMILMK